MMPKARTAKFDWCISIITLALLGSQWNIAPSILFPVIESWNDLWSNDLEPGAKLLEKQEDMVSLDSLRLPSKGRNAQRNGI